MNTENLRIVRATTGSLGAFGAHAAFNGQKAAALTSCEILAAWAARSVTMPHLILSLSPGATMFPTIAGPVPNWKSPLIALSQQGTYQRTGSYRPK